MFGSDEEDPKLASKKKRKRNINEIIYVNTKNFKKKLNSSCHFAINPKPFYIKKVSKYLYIVNTYIDSMSPPFHKNMKYIFMFSMVVLFSHDAYKVNVTFSN